MRNLILAGMVACLPAQAFALSMVCQDQVATGANWVNGKWQREHFLLRTYTLTDTRPESYRGNFCQRQVDSFKPWEGMIGDTKVSTTKACFYWAALGEPPLDVACLIRKSDDVIEGLFCDTLTGGKIDVVPNGEMVRTSHLGVPAKSPSPTQTRDSLYIAVGHCNVI